MANKGAIDLNVNALPENVRLPVKAIAYEILDNFSFGTESKTTNGRFFRFQSTTHGTANTEFSIAHGLGVAPTQIIPVLTLNQVGEQIVPLVVSRAADVERIYLKSSSTGAVFSMLVEI